MAPHLPERRFFGLPYALRALFFLLLAVGSCSAQSFSAPIALPVGYPPAALLTADFTGKGTPQLLAVEKTTQSPGFRVHVYANLNGNGFLVGSTIGVAEPSVLAMPQRPGMLPDLYWVGVSGSSATLFRAPAVAGGYYREGVALTTFPLSSTSASGFQAPSFLLAAGGLHAGFAEAILLADVANNQLYTVLPNPDGTYAVSPVSGTGGLTLLPGVTQLLTADLNGDGLPDLLVAAPTGVQVFLASAGTPGSFSGFTTSATYPCTGTVGSIALADMDADGRPDLLAEGMNGRIDIYHGNADGTFSSASEIGSGADNASTGNGGRLVGVADFNGDGHPELILANPQGITVLLGSASRSFRRGGTYAPGATPTTFVFTDLNGDGKPDIAFDSAAGITILYASNAGTVSASLSAAPEPSPYGEPITLSLKLAGSLSGVDPTGTVSFSVDGAVVGTGTVSGSTASYTIAAPAYTVGPHTVTAVYSGDTSYTAATFSGTHSVQGLPTVTTITNLVTPIYYGQEIGYTNGVDAVVGVNPADPGPQPAGATQDGGLIYVSLDGRLVCSLVSGNTGPTGGPQRCNDANFLGYPAGTHTMVAAYQGNAFYAPSTSVTYTVVILPDDTSSSLVTSLTPAPAGTAVTFSATLSAPYATPAGTVVFLDGATPIGTATLNAAGLAAFTTSSLAVGTHSITATYAATQNFNASQSALTQVITAAAPPASSGDFTLTVTPADLSIGVGNAAKVAVTVTESAAFNQPVALSCVGLPWESTCTFVTVTIPAGGGATALAIHPEAPHNCSDTTQYFVAGGSGRFALALSGLAVLLFGLRRRRFRPALFAALVCLLPLLGGCGLGSHCTDLGTRPGTYTFTVTATSMGSPAITHTQTVRMRAYLDGE